MMVKFTKMRKFRREISFKRKMKFWGLLSFKVMAEVVDQSDQ